MTPAFVIDASVAMAWCFVDESTDSLDQLKVRLERAMALVPSHWFLETANALAMAERRQRLEAADSDSLVGLLESLNLEIYDEPKRTYSHVLPLARAHGLTVYDAAYLDLARQRRLPLASLDLDLRSAATSLGIDVLGM